MLLILSLLTGIASGWIAIRSNDERVMVSLELVKVLPAIRKLKDGALSLVSRES